MDVLDENLWQQTEYEEYLNANFKLALETIHKNFGIFAWVELSDFSLEVKKFDTSLTSLYASFWLYFSWLLKIAQKQWDSILKHQEIVVFIMRYLYVSFDVDFYDKKNLDRFVGCQWIDYFCSIYYKNMEHISQKDMKDYCNSIHKKIQIFLRRKGIEFDIENFQSSDFQAIETLVSNPLLDEKEVNFLRSIISYIHNYFILNNLLSQIKYSEIIKIDTLEWFKVHSEYSKVILFLLFSVYSIINYKFIVQNDTDFETLHDVSMLKHQLGTEVEIWEIMALQKSYLFQEYFNKKIENIKLLLIFLKNPSLFLHPKKIPFHQLFEKIIHISDEDVLEKIATFLYEAKGSKMKQEVLLHIVDNIIKTNAVINNETAQFFIKYIWFWFDINDLLPLWIDLFNKVESYSGNKKELLQKLVENPNYFEQLQKDTFIKQLQEELLYLRDTDEGKIKIQQLIDTSDEMNLEVLKIQVISIKIQFHFDEKVAFHKTIFWKNTSNIDNLLEWLDDIRISLWHLNNISEILTIIFSYDVETIQFIAFLLAYIDFPPSLKKEEFQQCLDVFLQKRLLVQSLELKEKMSLQDLIEQLKGTILKDRFILQLQDLYSQQQYEILYEELALDTTEINEERVYTIINIWKKLSPVFKDDFVLHLNELSDRYLIFLCRLIDILQYYQIQIDTFWEYLLVCKDFERLNILKTLITKDLLNGISLFDKEDFKKEILDFLQWGSQETLKVYIEQLKEKQEIITFSNDLDMYLDEILKWRDTAKINILWVLMSKFIQRLLDSFHPDKLSSTITETWSGSWGFSKRINHYLFSHLKKSETESYEEYIKRVKRINWLRISDGMSVLDKNNSDRKLTSIIQSLWDENINFFEALIDFWNTYISKFNENSWNSTNLRDILKEYNKIIDEELQKIKRSLDL